MKRLKLSNDPKERRRQLARIKYEFEMLQKLHEAKLEGIPRYFEFRQNRRWITSKGDVDTISYVTMEYIEGFELNDLVER